MIEIKHTKIRKTATPRTGRILDAVTGGTATVASVSGGSSGVSYWRLVSTDADGNALTTPYILTDYTAVSSGDVVAYATGEQLSDYAPVATSSVYGLIKYDGTTLSVNSDGQLYVVSGGSSGGGIDETELQNYLDTNKYITSTYLTDEGYIKLSSPLTGYTIADEYTAIGESDTMLTALGKLERNFDNYVDLTTDQTVGGVKTFTEDLLSEKDVIAYATGETISEYAPVMTSTVYGLAKYDGETIAMNSSGQLYVLSASGGTIGGLTSSGTGNVVSSVTLNDTNSVILVNYGITALTPSNYTSYVLKIGTSDVGSTTQPIYLNAGVPAVCGSSLAVSITGNAATATYATSAGTASSATNATNATYSTYATYLRYDTSLWGQTFNGYNSVSGDISGAGNITASGIIYTSSYVSCTNVTAYGAESQFSNSTSFTDPWSNTACAIKASGNVGIAGNLRLYGSPYLYFIHSSSSYYWSISYSSSGGDLIVSRTGTNLVYFKATGTIAAVGDVVAYSSGSSISTYAQQATTSTMGLVKYDGSTISMNSSGQLYCLVSSGSSSGGTTVSWGTSTTNTAYLSVAGSSKQLTLAGGFGVTNTSSSQYRTIKIVGVSSDLSVNGHTHTTSDISNFPTSLKNPNSLTIQRNGSSLGSYDGSSAATINIQVPTSSGGSTVTYTNDTHNGVVTGVNMSISGYSDIALFTRSALGFGVSYTNYVSLSWYGNTTQYLARYSSSSDIRLKNVLSDVTDVLSKIKGIDVFRYVLKDDTEQTIQIGVSAQQILPLFPELIVNLDPRGYYGMLYDRLAVVALQGLKELYQRHLTLENYIKSRRHWELTKDEQIKILQQEVDKLKLSNEELTNKVSDLEGRAA